MACFEYYNRGVRYEILNSPTIARLCRYQERCHFGERCKYHHIRVRNVDNGDMLEPLRQTFEYGREPVENGRYVQRPNSHEERVGTEPTMRDIMEKFEKLQAMVAVIDKRTRRRRRKRSRNARKEMNVDSEDMDPSAGYSPSGVIESEQQAVDKNADVDNSIPSHVACTAVQSHTHECKSKDVALACECAIDWSYPHDSAAYKARIKSELDQDEDMKGELQRVKSELDQIRQALKAAKVEQKQDKQRILELKIENEKWTKSYNNTLRVYDERTTKAASELRQHFERETKLEVKRAVKTAKQENERVVAERDKENAALSSQFAKEREANEELYRENQLYIEYENYICKLEDVVFDIVHVMPNQSSSPREQKNIKQHRPSKRRK